MMIKPVALTAIALSLSLSASTHAAVIASDKYLVTTAGDANSYNDSADIGGQNPTGGTSTGFGGAWSASTFFDAGNSTSGLFHPASHSTAGNTSGAVIVSGQTSDPRNGTRPLSPGVAANAGTFTLWASCLFRFSPGTDDGTNRAMVGLLGSAPTNVSQILPTAGVVAFGMLNNMATVLPDTNVTSAVQVLDGSNQPINIADDTTHFFVVKIEHNFSAFDDRLTVWLDPTDASSELQLDATSAGKSSVVSNFYFDTEVINRIGYDSDGLANAGSTTRHDEFRLGDTLQDVAVPEPTGLALVTIGLLALAGRRRQRLEPMICESRL